MSFTSKNLQPSPRKGMTFLKGATFFFLGMSAVMFLTQAFEIIPMTRNVMTLMNKIVLTLDGNPSSTKTIILDGTSGTASFSGDIVVGSGICLSGVCNTSRPAGGSSVWSTGSSDVIYYNSGNVGIGTNVPPYKFYVNDDAGISNNLYFGSISGLGIRGKIYGNTLSLYIKGGAPGYSPAPGANVYVNGGNPNGTANTGNVIIANDGGTVGVATTTPESTVKLHVLGNIGVGTVGSNTDYKIDGFNGKYIQFRSINTINSINTFIDNAMYTSARKDAGGKYFIVNSDDKGVIFRVVGSGNENLMYVDTINNVIGIETNNPTAKLTVEGGIRPKVLSYRTSGSPLNTPCNWSEYPAGTIYYNAHAGVMCYCNNAEQPLTMTGGDCILPAGIPL